MKKIFYLIFLCTCVSWSQISMSCKINSSYTSNQIDCDSYQFIANSTPGNSTTILGYYWTFGDGNDATGQTVSHSYSNNGFYTVTLTTIATTGGTCCSDTKCFTVSVDCSGGNEDCGDLFDFNEIAINDGMGCKVVLTLQSNQYIINPGWSIVNSPTAYEWHLVHPATNVDRYEYGAPPHTTNLTDWDMGPWTITLKITLQNLDGDLCYIEHTENYLSGCGGNSLLNVYPNPIEDVIIIENQDIVFDKKHIEIYNQSGLKVREINLPKVKNFSLDVSELESGLYIFKIFKDNYIIKTETFIKQ